MSQLEEDIKAITVYSVGLCSASVCTPKDISLERIEAVVNAQYPTGVESKWKLSKEKTFASGDDNPCPCDRDTDTHLHYLMNC